MRIKKILVFLLIFFSSPCLGQLEINSLGDEFHEVPLIQSSWIEFEDVKIPLIPFSHTLLKRFFFDIFVVQLLVSDPDQINKSDILNLNPGEVISIHVTFLMSISKKSFLSESKKVIESYNINSNQKHIQSYLDIISNPIEKGDILIVTGIKISNDIEVIEIETSNEVSIIQSETGLIKDIFSLWLGDFPKHKYMQKMKNKLLEKIQEDDNPQ